MKKILTVVLIVFVTTFAGCSHAAETNKFSTAAPADPVTATGPSTTPESENNSETILYSAEQESVDELVDRDVYMLCRSYQFYKGTKNMSEIKSVTFSRTAPTEYDECWNANVADTEDVKGYLIGDDVVIVGEHIYTNSKCKLMFAAHNSDGDPLWSNLTEINGLELLNTSYTNSMEMMFAFGQFTELRGIGQWDVSKVESFAGMFQGNSHAGDMKLEYLDVGQWDTSSARNMSHVFYGCSLMTYIPIENWDVSKVGSFSHMFADCYSLQSIDFSKWETSTVVTFDALLNDCHSLVTVDVSGLDTATCEQFSQMFESCISLEHIIGLDTWDVSNAGRQAFSETFHGCARLKDLDIGNWVAAPDNTARMLKGCNSLTYVDMTGFDMSRNETAMEMFMNCKQLAKVGGIENWDVDAIQGSESMLSGTSIAT